MAVEFEAKGTRTSEYLFAPEQIEIHPEMNGRQAQGMRRSDGSTLQMRTASR